MYSTRGKPKETVEVKGMDELFARLQAGRERANRILGPPKDE